MATLVAKVYTIPVIVAHRTNVQGDVYTLRTPDYTDIVIVSGGTISCTCKEANCSHIQAVCRRRRIEAQADARHARLAATFDLSYGDGDDAA